jgi:hypothetical protein
MTSINVMASQILMNSHVFLTSLKLMTSHYAAVHNDSHPNVKSHKQPYVFMTVTQGRRCKSKALDFFSGYKILIFRRFSLLRGQL